jgi:hypothetical protein
MTAAAITATFSDYRLVKSRGVLQLVLELPVERQAQAFEALGFPMPGTDIHVGVARLQPVTGSSAAPAIGARPEATNALGDPVAPEGDENRGNHFRHITKMVGEAWDTLSHTASPHDAVERPADPVRPGVPSKIDLSRLAYASASPGEKAVTRAVLLCQDERFRKWLWPIQHQIMTADDAAANIRINCHIASRSELATNPDALARFLKLEAQYLADTNQIAEVRG